MNLVASQRHFYPLHSQCWSLLSQQTVKLVPAHDSFMICNLVHQQMVWDPLLATAVKQEMLFCISLINLYFESRFQLGSSGFASQKSCISTLNCFLPVLLKNKLRRFCLKMVTYGIVNWIRLIQDVHGAVVSKYLSTYQPANPYTFHIQLWLKQC